MSDQDISSMPEGLAALMRRAGDPTRGIPPVERWEPPFCGDLDIRIDSQGQWFYLGSPIGRAALVKLFASVLRKDADGAHYLVTPVEKVRIRVDDAPLMAVELHTERAGEARNLTLRTNVGDIVEAGPDHPISFRIEPETGGLKPYVLVRGRLLAKFTRPLLYQLADLLEEREQAGGTGRVEQGIWSGGAFFVLPEEAFADV